MVQGGLILKKEIANVSVSWQWSEQAIGLVEWTFTNNASVQQSGLLFRNNYAFGDAFWPLYNYNSKDFGTSFTSIVTPLADKGLQNNSMPLVVYQNPDGSHFVAFVFTIAPNSSWSCLEGGFSNGMIPTEGVFIPASKIDIEQFTIIYDSQQCQGYNQQSGTNLPCPPNPISVTSAVMKLNQQVKPLFNDIITPHTGVSKPSCLDAIIHGIKTLNSQEVIRGLECACGTVKAEQIAVIEEKF